MIIRGCELSFSCTRVRNCVHNFSSRVPINNSNIIREINKSFNVLKNDNVNEYFKKSYNFY